MAEKLVSVGRRSAVGVAVVLITSLGFIGSAASSEGAGVISVKPPVPEIDQQRTTRIVGGIDVDYPWQVALAMGSGSMKDDFSCGGTLIASDLVLTAAHCVRSDDGEIYEPIMEYGLRVLTGSPTLTGSQGQLRMASEIVTFTKYDPATFAWDVALLRLSSPTTVGAPIKIAGPTETALWTEGRSVVASGWGDTGDKVYPDTMKATYLTMVGDAPCAASWRRQLDWETQLCAGTPPSGGRSICQGDSGGPLVGVAASGMVRLVGASSFTAQTCGSYLPDGFAKVAADPIRSAIQTQVSRFRPDVDVIGAGETQAPLIDEYAARGNAGIYVGWACDRNRLCATAKVKSCRQATQTSFRCIVSQYIRRSGRKQTASRTVVVTDNGATISRRATGSWRYVRGWR